MFEIRGFQCEHIGEHPVRGAEYLVRSPEGQVAVVFCVDTFEIPRACRAEIEREERASEFIDSCEKREYERA